jgi:hypothetical protein
VQVVNSEFSDTGVFGAAHSKNIISSVDLVVGVLTEGRESDWALFELGQALALNKKILLVVPPKGVDYFPYDLNGLLTVRVELDNSDAIEFALDQLLAAPSRTTKDTTVISAVKALGEQAGIFISQANAAIQRKSGKDLERIVQNALIESGVEAMSETQGSDRGIDLAVWSDAFQFSVGNPLLIEVQLDISKSRLEAAVARLQKYLFTSSTKFGLLLYGVGPSSIPFDIFPKNIIIISVSDLLERMREDSFSSIIIRLRNKQIHGVVD